MSDLVQRIQTLQSKAETAKSQRDKAVGAYIAAKNRLRQGYHVKTLEEAQALLLKMKKQRDLEEAALEKEVSALEKELRDV